MRNFLPIKGPGGRALTPREKLALLVLGVTLVLCVLTLLAGESAYANGTARNPVFALVAGIAHLFGGGVVGLYALIAVWSGLIYFKGERIANISPIGGRLLAGCAVMVGISGALGIADNQTAGALGLMVGGSLGSALGGAVGMTLLLGLMLIGLHLSGQGAWTALRKPTPTASNAGGFAPAGSTTPFEANSGRMSADPFLPDDGDPPPDERSQVVTQAVEEIERSQGVTIVDVHPTPDPEPQVEAEPEQSESYYVPQSNPVDEEVEWESETEETEVTEVEVPADAPAPEPTQTEFDLQPAPDQEPRSSIGEQVDAAPAPRPETPEAEIQRGLREVSEALAREASSQPIDDGVVDDPFAPVPALEEELEEGLEEEEEEEEDGEEGDPNYYEPTYQFIEASPDEEEEAQEPEQAETGFAAASTSGETDNDDHGEQGAQAESGFAAAVEAEDHQEADPADPYARGGILERLRRRQEASADSDPERCYASFDWRGRPID